MASITFAIDEKLKPRLTKFNWVNWSELARAEILAKESNEQKLKRFKEILSKSKFTEKDAKELADKVSKSMHDDLVKRGLI